MGKLDGQVTLVTGGGRGLGRAVVRRFAAEGSAVVICGRTEGPGREIEAEVRDNGGKALYVQMDHTDEESVQRAIEAGAAEFGSLTILVNNAGGTDLGSLDGKVCDISLESWEALLRGNVTGPFLCAKYAIPHMLEAGGGVILNVSSFAAVEAVSSSTGYAVGKGALTVLSRNIAKDYGKKGVRCNTVVLGYFPHNEQIAALAKIMPNEMMAAHMTPYFGDPEDYAAACLFLCSNESRYITGASFLVDGGLSNMSRLPDFGGEDVYATDTLKFEHVTSWD